MMRLSYMANIHYVIQEIENVHMIADLPTKRI